VKGGGGLLLAAGAEIDGQVATDTLAGLATVASPDGAAAPLPAGTARRLAPIDPRHPVFRAFGFQPAALGSATFQQVATIRGGPGCQTVARFTTGEPAVVDCASGEGRALIVASDLDNGWNDLPRHASFVPFIHEAVRYLAAGQTRSSDYVVGDTPPGVPSQPGIVSIAAAGTAPPRQVAVNVDARESDPARLSADQFTAAVTRLNESAREESRLEARQQEERQRIWQYVLALMVVIMAAEGVVAARTT
jgi:hypothetical protein